MNLSVFLYLSTPVFYIFMMTNAAKLISPKNKPKNCEASKTRAIKYFQKIKIMLAMWEIVPS